MARWIEANGIALRYELSGDGGTPPLALIHEMGGMLESWDGVTRALSGACRILRYDQRGAGLSEKPPGAFAIDDLADDLAALLEAVGLAGPVTVAGAAVGAAVAIRFATRHRARAGALVLLAPATFLPGDRRRAALARADDLAARGFRATEASTPDEDPERRLRRFGNDPEGVAATMRMLAGLDLEADLAKISCPTLALAGRHDCWRPPAVVEKVAAAIPGAIFRVLGSGHVMALDSPALVASEIAAFIGRGSSR